HVERLAALDHVILGDDFEPIDRGGAVQHFLIVLRPETQAKAEKGRLFADHNRSRKSGNATGGAARSRSVSLNFSSCRTGRQPSCTRPGASGPSLAPCKRSCPCSRSWCSCKHPYLRSR